MSRTCKYCKDSKDHLISKKEHTIEAYVSKGYLSIFCGWCGASADIKIRYCPKCGRDMEADDGI